MLPELDVLQPHGDKLVHAEGVSFHHEDLVFVSSEGDRRRREGRVCLDKHQTRLSLHDYSIYVPKDFKKAEKLSNAHTHIHTYTSKHVQAPKYKSRTHTHIDTQTQTHTHTQTDGLKTQEL